MTKKLTRDAENMEQVAIETANKRELKYVYALAIATLHILEWIERNERKEDK